MTVYWVDPYLAATSQGNGTTDVSTKSGSYSAPFGLDDLYNASQTETNYLQGTTLADGDEVRIKGLPFATLFTLGCTRAYANSAYIRISNNQLNLADWLATKIVCFDPVKMAPYTEPCDDDYIIYPTYVTAVSNNTAFQGPHLPQLSLALTKIYNDPSSTATSFPMYAMNAAYYDSGTSHPSTIYFLPHNNNSISVGLSAGWDSATTQNGISIIVISHSASYRNIYNFGNNNKTSPFVPDLRKCHFISQNSSTGQNGNGYFDWKNGRTSQGSTDLTIPDYLGSSMGAYTTRFGQYNNTAIQWPDRILDKSFSDYLNIFANSPATTSSLQVNFSVLDYSNQTVKGYTTALVSPYEGTTIKIGSFYCWNMNNTPQTTFLDGAGITTVKGLEILDNSVLFYYSPGPFGYVGLALSDENNPSRVFPTTVGTGVYDWTDTAGPVYSGANASPLIGPSMASGIYTFDADLYSTNRYRPVISYDAAVSPNISNFALGNLRCGGVNYRSTDSNLNILNISNHSTGNSTIDSTIVPSFPKYTFETNDYDNRPISVIPPNSSGSDSLGHSLALLYNDIDNSDLLTFQAGAGTTNGGHHQLALPLTLPSYTVGTDNLKVDLNVTRINTAAFGDSSSKMWLGLLYYDPAASQNYRAESGTETGLSSLSTTPASPTTITLTLANLPTTGAQLSSALAVLDVYFGDASDYADKLIIHDITISVV